MSDAPRDLPDRDDLVLARTFDDPAARRHLASRVADGTLHRITPGVFTSEARWTGLSAEDRHVLLLLASDAIRRESLVFSHLSAAVLWQLPLLGDPPPTAHALADRAGGGRSDRFLTRHCVDIPSDTVRFGDLTATSLARTVVDVARSAGFAQAVIIADAALAGRGASGMAATRQSVTDLIPAAARGSARARMAVDFADPLSDSPGESLSRVTIARAGLPAPELQHRFVDDEGSMFGDFWWRRFDVVGEFDGRGKYVRHEFTGGRDVAEIVLDEKRREDRLRALGPRVVRWGWREASSPRLLGALLRSAGVRCAERHGTHRALPDIG